MDDYQKYLIDLFSNYRPSPTYPTYPPYHVGLYLEDYFFDRFIKENILLDRYYIPVFWTTCYIENKCIGLQENLNSLDPSKRYFTIAQHDDAIRENLPPNTICFNAGGNGGGIPIPLICSPIKDDIKPKLPKNIFCSFVGSITHPIRQYIFNSLDRNKYHFSIKNWTSSVSTNDFTNYLDISSRSLFSLCPRGYGRSSFRLYEVMQLGSIPVFIYDTKWCPFDDKIDWGEFCVLIGPNDVSKIDSILSSYSDTDIKRMQKNLIKYWKENFTMDSVYKKIVTNEKIDCSAN